MVRWIQAVNEPNLQEEERIWCKISVFLVSFLVFSFFIALFASIATEVDVVAVILDSSLCFQMMYTDRVRIQLHANPNSSHINCVAWFIVNMEWYISHYQTLLDIRLHIDLKYSLSTVFTKIQCSRMLHIWPNTDITSWSEPRHHCRKIKPWDFQWLLLKYEIDSSCGLHHEMCVNKCFFGNHSTLAHTKKKLWRNCWCRNVLL